MAGGPSSRIGSPGPSPGRGRLDVELVGHPGHGPKAGAGRARRGEAVDQAAADVGHARTSVQGQQLDARRSPSTPRTRRINSPCSAWRARLLAISVTIRAILAPTRRVEAGATGPSPRRLRRASPAWLGSATGRARVSRMKGSFPFGDGDAGSLADARRDLELIDQATRSAQPQAHPLTRSVPIAAGPIQCRRSPAPGPRMSGGAPCDGRRKGLP